jgi:hypothetical protein
MLKAPDLAGTFVVQLIVNDGNVSALVVGPVRLTVNVPGSPPEHGHGDHRG